MVQDDNQHVFGVGHAQQSRTDRDLLTEVEALTSQLTAHAFDVRSADVGLGEVEVYLVHRQNALERSVVVEWEHRPQHLLTFGDIDQCLCQCVVIERATKRQAERDVVGARLRI